jgi:hypothetical protein
MKAANSASLQLVGTAVAIIAIVSLGWSGHSWLSGKFEAQDTRIASMAREHGQKTVDLQRLIDSNKADMQRQIDGMKAAMKVMNVSQPKPMQQLVRDVMVDKSMPQSAMSRQPGYADKGSASSTAVKK